MLTRRQQEIMKIIHGFHEDHQRLPTLEEIAQAAGINTRSTIHQHIQALIQQGYLTPATGKRAYLLPEEALEASNDELALPFIGRIAAGKPITAITGQNEINPTALFQGHNRYVLEVQGDSMMEIGILNGDYVVIQNQVTAENGEIVVALIQGEEATLKRIFYHSEEQMIELRPENHTMRSMWYPAHTVQIQGKLVGLFRDIK